MNYIGGITLLCASVPLMLSYLLISPWTLILQNINFSFQTQNNKSGLREIAREGIYILNRQIVLLVFFLERVSTVPALPPLVIQGFSGRQGVPTLPSSTQELGPPKI